MRFTYSAGFCGDVQKRASVRAAAAFLDFGVNGAGHDVAGRELEALRIVPFHEAFAVFVAENAAFAAHGFGDQQALNSRGPDHAGRMELHEFHVQKFRAGRVSERHAVAGAFPGIGGDFPGFADAAGGDDHGFGFEENEAALFTPVAECAGDAVAVFEQASDGALHVDVDALLDAAILQRANHLEAGAVADVAEALERVAAESALQDVAAIGAIEKRAPLFEFADAVRRLLRV